jgi:hypothetical protein
MASPYQTKAATLPFCPARMVPFIILVFDGTVRAPVPPSPRTLSDVRPNNVRIGAHETYAQS